MSVFWSAIQRAIGCRTASANFGLLFCEIVFRLFLDVVRSEERRACQRKSYESNRAVLLRTKVERERERGGFPEPPTDV